MNEPSDEIDLPKMPDVADAATLYEIMRKSGDYYRFCDKALKLLIAMPAADRANFPDYRECIEAARLGLSAARQRQEHAALRLNRLASYGDIEAIELQKTGPHGPTLG